MKAHLLKKHLNNYPDDAEILIRKPNGVLVEADCVKPCFDGLLLSNCNVEEFEYNRKIIRREKGIIFTPEQQKEIDTIIAEIEDIRDIIERLRDLLYKK